MNVQTEPHNLTPLDRPRLWFGFATAVFAWLGLFNADLLVAWKVCEAGEGSLGIVSKTGALWIFAAITIVLLAITVTAGIVSFRTFRRLCPNTRLADAETPGREEFMALGGAFISVCMALGIIWLGLPLIIMNVCTRAR